MVGLRELLMVRPLAPWPPARKRTALPGCLPNPGLPPMHEHYHWLRRPAGADLDGWLRAVLEVEPMLSGLGYERLCMAVEGVSWPEMVGGKQLPAPPPERYIC